MITHGNSRREALTRMKRCLEVTVIEGIRTNLTLHQRILSDPEFQAGRFNTRFLEKYFAPADLARKAD
jgi:acetyl-CoA carboxylase biotin carboxylase subunit